MKIVVVNNYSFYYKMKRIIDSSLFKTCHRYRYYKQNGASKSILQLASIENRHFGMVMEYVVRDTLQMEMSNTKMHDAFFHGQRVEIKSSRIYLPHQDYKWSRLQPEKFDLAILVAVKPSGLSMYSLPSTVYENMHVKSVSLRHHANDITLIRHIKIEF